MRNASLSEMHRWVPLDNVNQSHCPAPGRGHHRAHAAMVIDPCPDAYLIWDLTFFNSVLFNWWAVTQKRMTL